METALVTGEIEKDSECAIFRSLLFPRRERDGAGSSGVFAGWVASCPGGDAGAEEDVLETALAFFTGVEALHCEGEAGGMARGGGKWEGSSAEAMGVYTRDGRRVRVRPIESGG